MPLCICPRKVFVWEGSLFEPSSPWFEKGRLFQKPLNIKFCILIFYIGIKHLLLVFSHQKRCAQTAIFNANVIWICWIRMCWGYIWSESDICSIWTVRHLSRLQKECFGRPKSSLFGGVRGVSVRVCSPPGNPSSKNIHKREKGELYKQPFVQGFRNKNMESLQHWPWKTKTVDKVRCTKRIGAADDGGQALPRPEGRY